MLKALGVGISPAGAVGFSAAIKWVTKDGLGAVGRMVVGGGLSSKFDEDPRRWRMIAELITTTGLALEIATQVYPVNFILLAGTGNLCKAIGKGMGRPCFRVVQTHFSATNNVGDVAAKEEVWEVSAQLLGLAASVAVLSAIEGTGSPEAIFPAWALIHGTHVALRYFSLKALEFPYPNMKRATELVKTHVHTGIVPSLEEVNGNEPVWLGPASCAPRVEFGCSVEEAVVGIASKSSSSNDYVGSEKQHELGKGVELAALVRVYADEKYMLTWQKGVGRVVLWDDSKPVDYMRALWQASWLEERYKGDSAGLEVLEKSLETMQRCFGEFEQMAEKQGWQLHRTVVPVGPIRLQSNALI